MPFSPILGNEIAKATLTHLLTQNTLPHALLFCGPKGVGKGAFAHSVAEVLMGPRSASRIKSGNHPDLHAFYPEGKAGLHPIENIRGMIRLASYPPFEADAKVFILHEAHRMLPASSNALLKILEEPQEDTYFFLLTSQADGLLPTIASRLRKIAFFPIPDPDIERFAKEKWHKEAQEAKRIAFLAHGSFTRAQQLATEQTEENRTSIGELFTLSLPQEYGQLLALCTAIEKSHSTEEETTENHAAVDDLLEEMYTWHRDLVLLKYGMDARHLIHPEAKALLDKRAEREIPELEEVLKALLSVRSGLERHISLRSLLEDLVMRLY